MIYRFGFNWKEVTEMRYQMESEAIVLERAGSDVLLPLPVAVTLSMGDLP